MAKQVPELEAGNEAGRMSSYVHKRIGIHGLSIG